MALIFKSKKVQVFQGKCLSELGKLSDNSIDAVVTDPPYGLSKEPDMAEVMRHWLAGDDYVHTGSGFMGKSWDSFVPGPSVWRECYRVLKPGGHLLSFAGSRTQDLMGLAIRLAGFEIRDSIAWLYGSGFPKSLNVSKAIDKAAGAERVSLGVVKGAASQNTASLGAYAPEYEATAPATEAAQQWQGWGTALKPAFEPIIIGRKPFPGTVAGNVLQHGTGAFNIDACRVASTGESRERIGEASQQTRYTKRGGTNFAAQPGIRGGDPAGRWPTNVVLDESQAAELDQQTGTLTSGRGNVRRVSGADQNGNTSAAYGAESRPAGSVMVSYGDSGGASRFFPVFKYQAKASTKERPNVDGTSHPTVKPLELMRWLVRLVTPPDGVVLDPFAGSGTTVEAALLEGFHCVAIEREADYLPLILQRLERAEEVDDLL